MFIEKIYFDRVYLFAHLNDGVVATVRLDKFQRLANASIDELRRYELLADGTAVHWPAVDEDISVEGLLRHATYVSHPGRAIKAGA